MGILPLKKRVNRDKCSYATKKRMFGVFAIDEKKRLNRDKCSLATKQRMFGVFAIDEILPYGLSPLAGSRTVCHPAATC